MTDKQPEVRSDIDKIYSAVIADSEALEDAKMTLEVIMKTDPGVYDEMINDTLSLIRKALSSSILSVVDRMSKVEIEMEPVAWMYQHEDTGLTMCVIVQQVGAGFEKNNPRWKKITPLYTAPPQREWQGLTDEEIKEIVGPWGDQPIKGYTRKLFDQIETKLKEKNS